MLKSLVSSIFLDSFFRRLLGMTGIFIALSLVSLVMFRQPSPPVHKSPPRFTLADLEGKVATADDIRSAAKTFVAAGSDRALSLQQAAATSGGSPVGNQMLPTTSGFNVETFTGQSTIHYPFTVPPVRGSLPIAFGLNYSSRNVDELRLNKTTDCATGECWQEKGTDGSGVPTGRWGTGDDEYRTPYCGAWTVAWNLTRVSDIHGNTAEFEYSQDKDVENCDRTKQIRLTKVKYNYDDVKGYVSSVQFGYSPSGGKDAVDNRDAQYLTTVSAVNDGIVIARYDLGYTYSFKNEMFFD